ncbi:hypothetical protein ERX35_008010 [Macrococcus equipercicus]|uniref:DUF2508 family protein n=1 Tax=Macrococcus equipercicus TaxID=69967 RepID=A0ABQ6R7T2_9STAP|nr:hypothetical protein [Macrococcus equipercicus]KAA1039150.1 hypothetical protein ERX35_008010 [Macrococcus equipercicus]
MKEYNDLRDKIFEEAERHFRDAIDEAFDVRELYAYTPDFSSYPEVVAMHIRRKYRDKIEQYVRSIEI